MNRFSKVHDRRIRLLEVMRRFPHGSAKTSIATEVGNYKELQSDLEALLTLGYLETKSRLKRGPNRKAQRVFILSQELWDGDLDYLDTSVTREMRNAMAK